MTNRLLSTLTQRPAARVRLVKALLCAGAALAAATLAGQESQPLPGSKDCLDCHDTGRRTGRREAGVPPAFDAAALRASPHAELECRTCHADLANVKEFPHPEKLKPVDCGACHTDEQAQYAASLHGRAAARGDKLAPSCKTCHGTHTVQARLPPRLAHFHHSNPPALRAVPQGRHAGFRDPPDPAGQYPGQLHGQHPRRGLYKKGLTVTAVCTSCHTAHHVLPHTDPQSSIAKQNIAKTCTKCHAQIETVHQKVIRGELWEKQPHMIPACVDCHEPHKIRQVFYPQGMADLDCQRCHANPELKTVARGQDRLAVRETG